MAKPFSAGGGVVGVVTKFFDSGIIGAPQASFDVTGMPATGVHFAFVINGASTVAAQNDSVFAEINGDTTAANYLRSRHEFKEDTTHSINWLAAQNCGTISGASATAGEAQQQTLFLGNYAGATFRKQLLWTATYGRSDAQGDVTQHGATIRLNIAAVTSVKFSTDTGNFDTGSRCTAYSIS